MNRLELNEDQRDNLREMCNKLFPKIQNPGINDDGFITEYTHDNGFKSIIHWFEFCMTHLVSKIDHLYSEKYIKSAERKAFEENNYPEGLPKNWNEIWDNRPWNQLWIKLNGGCYKEHPVDYLYEQFKKIK